MSPIKRYCIIAITGMLVVASVALLTGITNAEDEGISVKWVEYLPDEGKVSFSGATSSDYVNVMVVGNGFESQVKPCQVVNGSFSGSFVIGQLEPGEYQVLFKSPGHSITRNIVVSSTPQTTINTVDYDAVDGKVSFSGTSSFDYVNVMVVGNGFESQVKPCQVVNGSFSGSFVIGQLEPGEYCLIVKSLDGDKTREFEVSNVPISVRSVTFDPIDARMTVMGRIYSSDVAELTLSAPGNQNYDTKIWVDEDRSFVSYFFVGRLIEEGTYQLKVKSLDLELGEFIYRDPTSNSETVVDGNTLRDNGSTLVRFTGSANQYSLPSSVTRVLEGAFDSCSIGTFILDRDVHWELDVMDGMTYPFQNSSLNGLVIKEGVTSIPDYLFAKTGISDIVLPASMKNVGVKSFYDCDSITHLEVKDNNCLTKLGDYSFSYNDNLSTITFGSSAYGYCCDLGMAAFLFSSNIRAVELDEDFNLKSIGSLCFTKKLVKGYGDPLYAINFNTEYGIVIPKEVEEIGFLAFSMMVENNNVVPAIYPNTEPLIGTFIYNGDGHIRYGGMRSLNGDNFGISFEQGSQLTSIGIAAFAGYVDVKTIDLSNCQKLTVIQRMAFAACLNDGSLILPPNIEELYESFDNSSGQLVGLLPDSLRICDNALGSMRGTISVSSNSALVSWSDNRAGSITELNLAGAANLEKVNTGCSCVSLPAGVFEGNINVGKLKEDVGPVIGTNTVTIRDTTTFLNWDMFSSELICSDGNPYFKDYGDAIYFEKQDIIKLLQVKQSSDVFVLKAGAQVREGIIGPTVIELKLEPGYKLDANSLSACNSLQTLKINGSVDVLMMESALSGITTYPMIVVPNGISDWDIMRLGVYGQVGIYLNVNDHIVNIPAVCGGNVIHYAISGNDTINVDSSMDGIVISSSGVKALLEGNRIVLNGMQSECYIWFVDSSNLASNVSVTLDANGGSFIEGVSYETIIRAGKSISSITKTPARNLNDFIGWSLEPNGSLLDDSHKVFGDCVLYAQWASRGPRVTVNDEAAILSTDNGRFNTSVLTSGSSITLIAEPRVGYELFDWIVNGEVRGSADQPLTCTNITGDTTISLTFRYYSPSSGLNGESNRGLPTMVESDDLVFVTELGGVLNMSTAIWEGHASVPLVVDDRIYFRAGNRLYAAESDTGYIIASVLSAEAKDYYHQLGYGAGVIIDYKTGKAYDLNLNQLFVLPATVYGAEYYNGLFYTSGRDVYSFTATDDNPNSRSEVKTMTFVGHIDDVFSSYGFSRSVFVDHYMYRVVASGHERGIAAMDLDTGMVQVRYLESIRSMYLDDGWISYYNGYIYLPGYTTGLFGAVATGGYDTLAFIDVNGLNFGTEDHFTFTKTGFVSETLFYDGKAYIYAGGDLYSFDIVDGKISKTNPRHLDNIVIGHGSMVMEVGYDGNGEKVVYLYIIPYTSFNICMTVIEDREGTLSSHAVYGLPQNYNSQAVRADIDGRMIWYNDSGHIYDYTTPEKNVYYFFIEDDEHAQWYEAYGRNAAEALRSLGSDVVSLDDYKRVTSLFGKAVDSPTIKVLKQNTPTEVTSNLKSYSWVKLNDLYDRSYDTCHYYRITASGNGTSTFSYLNDDGTVGVYAFQENIGDGRRIVGKMLVPGTEYATVRFFDGSIELTELTTIYSKTTGASWDLPSISRNGTEVVWTIDGNIVTSMADVTVNGTDVSLYGTWPVSAADLSKDVTVSVEGNVKTVCIVLSDPEGAMYLNAIIETASGFTEQQYELKQSNDWTASFVVADGTKGVLLYLVRSSEQSFSDNVGRVLLMQGAVI